MYTSVYYMMKNFANYLMLYPYTGTILRSGELSKACTMCVSASSLFQQQSILVFGVQFTIIKINDRIFNV